MQSYPASSRKNDPDVRAFPGERKKDRIAQGETTSRHGLEAMLRKAVSGLGAAVVGKRSSRVSGAGLTGVWEAADTADEKLPPVLIRRAVATGP